jgi:hypothetical protein
VLFYDELLYKNFSESLLKKGFYTDPQYPPLYPLAILPSLFFGEHFYEAIKILNNLYSSAIIFPTFLIAQLFLSRKASIWCAILSALLPYHLAFSGMVMSENIYYVLFLLTIYAVINPKWRIGAQASTVVTGILIGSLLLTRHMSLAVVPMLIMIWYLKPSNESHKLFTKKRVFELIILLLSVFVTYGIWLVPQLISGDITQILTRKFIYSKSPVPTASKLLWIGISLAYVILLIAPIIHTVTGALTQWKKKFWEDVHGRYKLLVTLLTVALIFITARHHWRAGYNIPDPDHIHGRYLMYIAVPLIILGIGFIEQVVKNKITKGKLFLICTTSIAVFFISHLLLIERSIIALPHYFLMDHIAPSVYLFKLLPDVIPVLIVLFMLYTGWLIYHHKKYALTTTCSGFAIFLIIFNYYFFPSAVWHRATTLHGSKTAEVIREAGLIEGGTTIYLNDRVKDKSNMRFKLKFWGLNTNNITISDGMANDEIIKNKHGILRTGKKLDEKFVPVAQYTVRNREYYIYNLELQN